MEYKRESGTHYTMHMTVPQLVIYAYDSSSASYTWLLVVTGKNESEMSEAKEVRSKVAAVETVEDSSELVALTQQVAYVIATWDSNNSTSSNQRNKGQKKKRNRSENREPDNTNRNNADENNGSIDKQN